MTDTELKKLQYEQFEMLREVKRIATIAGVNYFLDAGTLLGAVRHHGFIPWDDDLDVGLIRKDYEKFIKQAELLLNEKYFIQTWDNDENYPYPFAKIRLKNSLFTEEVTYLCGAKDGIYIDIFPYDAYPDSFISRKIQGIKYTLYRGLLLAKYKVRPWFSAEKHRFLKKAAYFILGIISKFFSKNFLKKRYMKNCTRFNDTNHSSLFQQGIASYGKCVIKKEWLNDFVLLPFFGEDFSCPCGFKEYLSYVYGNYMKLPPENKRGNRHKIIALRFPNK